MGLFSLEKLFGMTIRESATDGSDFTNPDADYRRLFLGEDGQLHVKDSAGSVTDIGAGTGAPTTADYLVGTAQGGLSAEIVVGTSPGGELGGTWASPSVDAVHAGTHHGNMWKMSQAGASETLTNNTDTLITWDTADIDGGESCIDLANDRFVAPTTGFYLALFAWMWEGTAPASGASATCLVGSTEASTRIRITSTTTLAANQGANGSFPLSLTVGDFVTLKINPAAVTGVTARGNASIHLRTSFTLIRIT